MDRQFGWTEAGREVDVTDDLVDEAVATAVDVVDGRLVLIASGPLSKELLVSRPDGPLLITARSGLKLTPRARARAGRMATG